MLVRLSCISVLSLVLVSYAGVLQNAPPQVRIGKTTLIGRGIPALGQDFFGGIPYAEPPVASLRLRPPMLKTRLNVPTFDATNYGKGCLQLRGNLSTLSEDCLTINVFRPSGSGAGAKLPVMFWTYGGGFDAGASSSFNGSAIVSQGMRRGTPIIYVSFNYRLGPLGYPQGQEAANEGALNLALKDELAALEWVQANIASFGGDPRKVTAFGESAGAIMTAILVLDPGFAPLARAAIFESGSAASALEFPASHREVDWQHFVGGVSPCAARATSGATFACLRSAGVTEADVLAGVAAGLGAATELFAYDPTIDGPGGVFPDIASRLIAAGRFARVPFIAGTNLDEGTLFTPTTANALTPAAIRASILGSYSPPLVGAGTLDAAADRLLALYPDDPAAGAPFETGAETFGLPTGYKRLAAMTGDLSFDSQRRSWMNAASAAGVRSYGYRFTQAQPQSSPALGVSHGAEVAFVFGEVADPDPAAQRLSDMMIDYWVAFAVTLDPNDGRGTQRPVWAPYTPRNRVLLQLDGANTTLIADDYRAEQIAFINADPAVFHHRRGERGVRVEP